MYIETVSLFKEWKKEFKGFFFLYLKPSVNSQRIYKVLQLKKVFVSILEHYLLRKFGEVFTK